jgi:uncharacterized protein (TIGR02996 family)
MNEEAAFLRAICEHPDEDTPRLVFADWLDEKGGQWNTAWAELIRVQVSMGRGLANDREHQQRLARRDRELTPLVDYSWARGLGLPERGWGNWSRGFPLALRVYYLGLAVSQQFASAPPIPIRGLELVGVKGEELNTFLKWPGLRQVRDLDLFGIDSPFAAESLALARCEFLSKVERLRLGRVILTNKEALAILESPHLSRVTELRIDLDQGSELSPAMRLRLRKRFGAEWNSR